MSLCSCLVTCSTGWSCSSTVMVMRETAGFSVSATTRLSMFETPPGEQPRTRVRTPGLFSTRTERVCFMVHAPSCRAPIPRRDHGEDIGLPLDPDVDDSGPVARESSAQHLLQLLGP